MESSVRKKAGNKTPEGTKSMRSTGLMRGDENIDGCKLLKVSSVTTESSDSREVKKTQVSLTDKSSCISVRLEAEMQTYSISKCRINFPYLCTEIL